MGATVWRLLVHLAGVDYGLPYGHWGWYNFWSGIAGSFLVSVTVWLATRYAHRTCHTWWCPRRGLYAFTDEATGISHQLCRHCHPDHPGYRLNRRYIAHIHQRNREIAHQGKGDARMSQHIIPAPFRAGHVPGEKPAGQRHLTAAAAAGSKTLLADLSEFQPDIDDAAYLKWSQAVVIRALYGTSHIDKAWYGGARRAALHRGGARFCGIYQFLVAGQDGAAQARAFHALVGAIQPGEVFIADAEQGAKSMLTAWRNEMVKLYGTAIEPYLWTYTGLAFGEETGLLPVQWIAAYQSAEPSTPHTLWQFTDRYNVPGVGTCDCSVAHMTISELAALAYGGQQQPSSEIKVWITQGQKSLADLCSGDLHNGVSTVLRLTAEHSAGAVYTSAMAAYLNEVFAADKARIPAGVILFHPSGRAVAQFTSHGTQTLQGLANAWHCEPSTVIRLTAEHSPGAVFSSGMASYLNAVFARSMVHVPSGVHLYYQP